MALNGLLIKRLQCRTRSMNKKGKMALNGLLIKRLQCPDEVNEQKGKTQRKVDLGSSKVFRSLSIQV